MQFELLATDGTARRARVTTAHGEINTPVFMPVGTYGMVKALDPHELVTIGSQICLLYTSPSPRDQRGSRMPSSA